MLFALHIENDARNVGVQGETTPRPRIEKGAQTNKKAPVLWQRSEGNDKRWEISDVKRHCTAGMGGTRL